MAKVSHMVQPLATQASISNRADDDTAIAAVIDAETQAFVNRNFEDWAACWVQSERTTEVRIKASTGLEVVSGWDAIAASTRHALENGSNCGMVRFRNDGYQIMVEGPIAWAVYNQWSEDAEGTAWEKFETRILEHGEDGWKIVYSSFVELRGEGIVRDALSVDAHGHVIWASPEVTEKLRHHPILTISAGRVRARRRDWDHVLQKAIAQAGRYHEFFDLVQFTQETGGPFRYPAVLGETDEGGVAVVQVSVRDGTTYLQFDSDGALDRRLSVAQAVFGLSDGQLRVARHIANGAGLKSTAEALGISVNTARTHLSRLYEKTGVSSQTALVKLLLSVG